MIGGCGGTDGAMQEALQAAIKGGIRDPGHLEITVKELFSATHMLLDETMLIWDALAQRAAADFDPPEEPNVIHPVTVVQDLAKIKGRIHGAIGKIRDLRQLCAEQLGDMRLVAEPIVPAGAPAGRSR